MRSSDINTGTLVDLCIAIVPPDSSYMTSNDLCGEITRDWAQRSDGHFVTITSLRPPAAVSHTEITRCHIADFRQNYADAKPNAGAIDGIG